MELGVRARGQPVHLLGGQRPPSLGPFTDRAIVVSPGLVLPRRGHIGPRKALEVFMAAPGALGDPLGWLSPRMLCLGAREQPWFCIGRGRLAEPAPPTPWFADNSWGCTSQPTVALDHGLALTLRAVTVLAGLPLPHALLWGSQMDISITSCCLVLF